MERLGSVCLLILTTQGLRWENHKFKTSLELLINLDIKIKSKKKLKS